MLWLRLLHHIISPPSRLRVLKSRYLTTTGLVDKYGPETAAAPSSPRTRAQSSTPGPYTLHEGRSHAKW